MNMAHAVEFYNQVHLASYMSSLKCEVWHYRVIKLVLCDLQVLVTLLGISCIYWQCVSAVIISLVGNMKCMISPSTPHQTVSKTLREWGCGFGIFFGTSSLSNHLADLFLLMYNTHFSSQVTVRSRKDSLLWRVTTLKRSSLFFSDSSSCPSSSLTQCHGDVVN